MRIPVFLLAASAMIAAFVLASRPSRPNSGEIVDRRALADGHGYVELLSDEYLLDRVYTSMTGPSSNQAEIRLAEQAGGDETIWLTGVETNVVAADERQRISNEFFCHGNLTLSPRVTNPETHNASFKTPLHMPWRLFTLVPGRMSIRLPDGFGLPLKNRTLVDYYSMSLSQNPGEPQRRIRLQTRVSYRRVQEGEPHPRPLFRRSLYVYQQHQPDRAPVAAATVQPGHQGEWCGQSCDVDQTGGTPSLFFPRELLTDAAHPGATCCVANASAGGVLPQFGDENTIHWMVPPGAHQYRTEVTEQIDLPFDTTAHYVTGHLHPFGKSLTLLDIETGRTVLRVEAKCFADRLGVESMSEVVSQVGIPLRKGRRYELVAEYDNDTNHPIDAMAILYIYALESDAAKQL